MDVLSFEQIKRWGVKGGFAVLDQGLYSGANFIGSILLARWLDVRQFGEFAIGFTILIFFMQIYTSFILEPMGILGPSNYGDRLKPYLRRHVDLLFIITTPVAVFLAASVVFVRHLNNDSSMSPTLFYSLLGLPFFLFPLLMRRIFYVLQKPGFAFLGSVVYFFGLTGCLLVIKEASKLTSTNGTLVVLLSASASGLLMLSLLRTDRVFLQEIDLKSVLREIWSFGRWLLLSGLLIGLATQSQVYLTGILSNLEDAGAVRILQNFIQPMMLVFTALSALVTPIIASAFASGNYQSVRRKIAQFIFGACLLALTYECLLILFGNSLSHALFFGKYSIYASQIPIWGLIPLIWSLFWGGVIALQAIQKPNAMVVISGVWAISSLVSGLTLIPSWGVWGATVSIFSGFFVAFIGTWILYWFLVHRKYNSTRR